MQLLRLHWISLFKHLGRKKKYTIKSNILDFFIMNICYIDFKFTSRLIICLNKLTAKFIAICLRSAGEFTTLLLNIKMLHLASHALKQTLRNFSLLSLLMPIKLLSFSYSNISFSFWCKKLRLELCAEKTGQKVKSHFFPQS